jgi:hypothetical protein
MTQYYIASNGNDTTGLGTQLLPWLTLSKAGSIAVAGDTINVASGTYASVDWFDTEQRITS